MKRKILLLTPPLLQTNSPYPATMHLAGWLDKQGVAWEQRDLSIKVVRDVLLRYGDETTEELLEFLGGNAPSEAKREASELIDELAIWIRDEIDPEFGFGRYAEEACRRVSDFGALEKFVRRRGVIDAPLRKHLKAAMDETRPTEVWVTCPFPGTLVGAFKIAKYVRAHYPKVKLVLGGGYVNTELRSMTDKRPYRYFDVFQFDSPYAEPFVAPDYRGIDWNEYFDVVETDNFVTNLWNFGKWVKLVMAQGCYWHKCAFCDVCLPYIDKFRMPTAKSVVDCMETFASSNLQLQLASPTLSLPPQPNLRTNQANLPPKATETIRTYSPIGFSRNTIARAKKVPAPPINCNINLINRNALSPHPP